MRIGSRYTGRVRVEDHVDSIVSPGETYQATCRPIDPTILSEILVYDFALVELKVNNHFVETRERAGIVGSRIYQLERVTKVTPSGDVYMILKNDTDRPLRIRQATLEEQR